MALEAASVNAQIGSTGEGYVAPPPCVSTVLILHDNEQYSRSVSQGALWSNLSGPAAGNNSTLLSGATDDAGNWVLGQSQGGLIYSADDALTFATGEPDDGTSPFGFDAVHAVLYDPVTDQFVAVGADGERVLTSANKGKDWTDNAPAILSGVSVLNSIATDGVAIAFGGAATEIWYTTDNFATVLSAGTIVAGTSQQIYGLRYDPVLALWVAVTTTNGNSTSSGTGIFTSPSITSPVWTLRYSSPSFPTRNSITYGDGLWIGLFGGGWRASLDLLTWLPIAGTPPNSSYIAWAGQYWLAGGAIDGSVIQRSDDLDNWTPIATGKAASDDIEFIVAGGCVAPPIPCAYDYSFVGANLTLAEDDRLATLPAPGNAGAWDSVRTSFTVEETLSYHEYEVTALDVAGGITVGLDAGAMGVDTEVGQAADSIGYRHDGTLVVAGVETAAFGPALAVNDIVALLLNLTTGDVFIRVNGADLGGGDPEAGTSPAATLTPTGNFYSAVSLTGNATAGDSAVRGHWQGPFTHPPPEGYTAPCIITWRALGIEGGGAIDSAQVTVVTGYRAQLLSGRGALSTAAATCDPGYRALGIAAEGALQQAAAECASGFTALGLEGSGALLFAQAEVVDEQGNVVPLPGTAGEGADCFGCDPCSGPTVTLHS